MLATISHTHPASDAMKTTAPSHSTGWQYQLDAMDKARGSWRGIITVREVIDIGGEHADLIVAEARAPRRHVALSAAADGRLDIGHAATVQPDMVGEIGRTKCLIALAIRPVTGRTDRLEGRLGGLCHRRVMR